MKLFEEKYADTVFKYLIYLFIPLVFLINWWTGIFMGGLLLISTTLAAIAFSRRSFVLYFFLSAIMYLVSVFFQDGSIKKFIVQGIVYGISLLFATFMGESQRIKNQKILKQQEDNSKLATELIHAFVKAIDAKDHYLHNHSYNVSYYARLLAKQLKVPRIETERICLAALLHDIGKLDVSGTILNKPGRLTEEEWQIMKVHPERGAEILRCIEELDFLYERIKYHHRNFDGSGYPIDCPIEEVPFDAYIIAVADAFDAMTSDRPYRKALSNEAAYEELKTCAGTQFHPKVVEAFFSAGIVPVENEILHIDLQSILNDV